VGDGLTPREGRQPGPDRGEERRAQASGDARTDVDDDDARYIMGAAAMNFASEQQRQRMLDVLFDGLRAR
jgi:hypothetical protein